MHYRSILERQLVVLRVAAALLINLATALLQRVHFPCRKTESCIFLGITRRYLGRTRCTEHCFLGCLGGFVKAKQLIEGVTRSRSKEQTLARI